MLQAPGPLLTVQRAVERHFLVVAHNIAWQLICWGLRLQREHRQTTRRSARAAAARSSYHQHCLIGRRVSIRARGGYDDDVVERGPQSLPLAWYPQNVCEHDTVFSNTWSWRGIQLGEQHGNDRGARRPFHAHVLIALTFRSTFT